MTRSIEEVRALFQQIAEQEQQFATGSGGGAAGSRVTFSLGQSIAGSNSVVATCLTDCPPGDNRTALVRADDGQWYAFTQSPTTQGSETISQNRRSEFQEEGGKVAALVEVRSGADRASLFGRGVSRKLYLAGHGVPPVFLCSIEPTQPMCPPIEGDPINNPNEITTAYYVGGNGFSFVDWAYNPKWYCPAFRGGLGQLDSSPGTCPHAFILIPPILDDPLRYEYRFPVTQSGFSAAGKSFYFDANDVETYPRCVFPDESGYNYAIERGVNMNPAFGRVGAFSFNSWRSRDATVYFATKTVEIPPGGNPPGTMTFTATTEFEDDESFGVVDGVFTATMSLIGHSKDPNCVPPSNPQEDPIASGVRDNNTQYYLSGDRGSWYVTVYDKNVCSSDADPEDENFNIRIAYAQHRYFKVQGSSVETSSTPYSGDWRHQQGRANKNLSGKHGNLFRNKFLEIDLTEILFSPEQNTEEERPKNALYTPQMVKIMAKNVDLEKGTLQVEDKKDENGQILKDENGEPIKVESKGKELGSVRMSTLAPDGQGSEAISLPFVQLLAAVF